jgi:hypothetical protein
VRCEGEELDNVFTFKYLGSQFAADGSQEHDMCRRIGMVMTRCGKLCHIFNSDVKASLKLKIYITAACSLMTYGSEG